MKRVFLCGIAGTGMSALAGLFRQSGWQVSGSDVQFYPPVGDILRDLHVHLFNGYDAANIAADTDLCVIGNVISRGNPEAEKILNEGFEYISMAEALGRYFIKGKHSVVVAGTHGKTTITSFIAHLLETAGLKPGFFIGGKPLDFPTNHRIAAGDYFVSEGDEYETAFFDRSSKFLKYYPRILILTSLEYDHLDVFPSEQLYLRSFQNLVNMVPSQGLIIANDDFPMVRQALERTFSPVRYYGEKSTDSRIEGITPQDSGFRFRLKLKSGMQNFISPLPGRYNVANLAAGILLAEELGITYEIMEKAIHSFQGVERRLQLLGKWRNTLYYEDFAHHPTAIAAVLQSLREQFPDRSLTALFEPRSWSLRRRFFQDTLPASFAAADTVMMADVYDKSRIPEAERLDPDKIACILRNSGKDAYAGLSYTEIRKWLEDESQNGDRVVVLLSNGAFGGIPDFIRQKCQKSDIIHT